jgi:8-oxo-dGTP diphosphatase
MKSLVFGTTNPGKLLQIQGALKPLGISVVGLPSAATSVEVIEGDDLHENARKKALTYAQAIEEPVLSMDNGLYFDDFPPEEQPGPHVRRIGGTSGRPSDTDLLNHYSALVARLGDRARAKWEFALCYARPDGTFEETTIESPRIFVSTPSKKVVPGYPLESIQIEPESGQHISEMSQDEQDKFWQRAIGTELCRFVSSLS